MNDFHIKNSEGVRNLSAAVFVRSYEDWVKLCRLLAKGYIVEINGKIFKGPKAPRGYVLPTFSFIEIETFIRDFADDWVDMNPDDIMTKLDTMKRKAVYDARRHT